MTVNDWKIFVGKVAPDLHRADEAADEPAATLPPDEPISGLPAPPPWRQFGRGKLERDQRRGQAFRAPPEAIEMVNAALYLRRPLLVTGKPGTGKSTLVYAVAEELRLGPVLRWPVN